MSVLNRALVKRLAREAAKDYGNEGMRISSEYLDALEQDIRTAIRRHVAMNNSHRTLCRDVVDAKETIKRIPRKGGKRAR